ncbi:zinc ribbon domain-containing protein [Paraburkholderia sp. USG1]|uniref:zinc ribbon domain-containing protein n=1 Tax=Paraburkholderia sp. USG1 TaxID=2952268 RepID=UPI00286738AA|nr:zinc ribbon domain-containing protein [Paraburkholderia sp. USG1]MDR8398252.1 zinc ribbon domain-containing protein [Paraburkholderia sp. USG1]
MLFVVVWLVCMIITALVASSKNRSPAAWALLAIPFGLIATVVVACSSKLPDSAAAPSGATNSGSVKTCPRCAETVKAAAQVCRFCQHEFTDLPPPKAVLPWKLEEDWGNGYGIFLYKGHLLKYNKSGVKWQSSKFESPELAIASIDSYEKN